MTSSVLISMTTRQRSFQLLTLALMVVLPIALIGQGYFGTVSGTLTDPTGAVVQGANVVLTDEAKGFTFKATSDASGRYLFRSIPPGLYSVTAEMQGFQKMVRAHIKVDVNENATADMSLKMAGSQETVQVEAQGQTIATEDAVTGQVINRKFINDLPLIGRNAMDLTYLTPGVTEMDDNCRGCGGTNFVSNGSRGATADILMDGASVTNFEPNGGVTQATYVPSPEAVEEFKVQQSNFSAEFGFSGASVVNLVTRSGSNSFHGSAYDFLRNQVLDSNNWFNNHYGVPIPPLRRNNYGGTIGGPIFKNKTFFFFDYDGTRETTMSTYQAGLPSLAERAGDFGELCAAKEGTFDSNGLCSVATGQIWDPYSGVYDPNAPGPVRSTFIPFNNIALYTSPGNPKLVGTPFELPAVAGNLIDPIGQKMMNLFPTPNISNGDIYDNWIGSGPNHGFNDQFDIKIDHRFSDKNLLSAKYSHQWNHGDSFNCFKNFTDPCHGGPNHATANLFAINDTHTFSPTLLLNVTFGFTRGAMKIDAYDKSGVDPLNNNAKVADPLSELGFPSYLGTNGFAGVPAIFIGGSYFNASGYGLNMGTNPWGNYKQGQDTGQLTAAVSKVHGPHEMKFGFEGRIHQQNYIQTNAPVGTFSFDENGTSACTYDYDTCGGDAMASFLMGRFNGDSSYEIQIEPATTDHQFAWYALDNWKVNHKLTLNLGLRYDVSIPRTDRHNRQNWLDLNVVSPLQVPALGTLHGGEVFASSHQRHIVNTDWKDIQPRFGLAYQVTPETVVRGGYGIYYSQPRSGATGVAPYGTQGFNQWTSVVANYQSDGATPYLHMNNPYPNGLIQPAGSSLGLMNDVGFGAIGPIRNVTNTPYEQTWTFGIERQLRWNVLVNAEYIGKKGTHLYFAGANQPNHLGPEVEQYSQAQINSLNTFVPNPFFGVITDPNSSLSASEVQQVQLQVPYPQFTWMATDVAPIANSTYHAMQLTAEKRYSNGLQFLVSYTWSKSIDDASAQDDNTTWLGSFVSLQDPNKPWLERSLSTFDIPHVVQFSYTYDLPFGRGRAFFGNMPRVLEAVAGGWKTNGIWRISAGRPITLSLLDGTSLPTYGAQRPNLVGTPKRNNGPDWIDHYFANPEVFQQPAQYALGNAPRAIGSVRTPRWFTADLSVAKEFSLSGLREGMKLEFRVEAQNAFNHPVFGTPNSTVDDENFGQISYTSNGPREVQLALKFSF